MELIELSAQNIHQYLQDCLMLQTQLVSNPESINPAHFIATAESNNSYLFGVLESDHVIAMGVVSLVPHPVDITGYVNNIVVDEKHRGKGLFKVVMGVYRSRAYLFTT
jgi:hypothetical protein